MIRINDDKQTQSEFMIYINEKLLCLSCKEPLVDQYLNEREIIFICSNKEVNKFLILVFISI